MTIKILTQSSHMKFFFEDKEIEKKVNKILRINFSAEDLTIKNSYGYKKGYIKSAEKSLYIEELNLLPIGFLPWVKHFLEEENIKYEINDLRKYPPVDKTFVRALMDKNNEFKTSTNFIPRYYQKKAVLSVIKNKGGLINSATGTGKSLMVYLITQAYHKSRILLLFNSINLIDQTYNQFIEYGIDPNEMGIIQGSGRVQEDKRITLLSVASYEHAYNVLPFVRVIVVDESHELGSGVMEEQATKVLYSCQNAPIRVGLSATNDVIDNPIRQLSLYGNLGPIVFNKKIKEHTDEGNLAQIYVKMHTVKCDNIPVTGSYGDMYKKIKIKSEKEKSEFIKKHIPIVNIKGAEYAKQFINFGDESTHYVYNHARTEMLANLAKTLDYVLILYTRIEHGKFFKKLLPDAFLISGDDDVVTRNKAIGWMKKDPKNIVIASNVFAQGIDIPHIKNLILAGGGKGTVPVIQKLGRATRKDKDTKKDSAIVHDCYDVFSPLSIKQTNRRKNIYENELHYVVEIIK